MKLDFSMSHSDERSISEEISPGMDEMVVYLDGGAIGKTRHHYQGQAGLQKEDFYNCNKFWF